MDPEVFVLFLAAGLLLVSPAALIGVLILFSRLRALEAVVARLVSRLDRADADPNRAAARRSAAGNAPRTGTARPGAAASPLDWQPGVLPAGAPGAPVAASPPATPGEPPAEPAAATPLDRVISVVPAAAPGAPVAGPPPAPGEPGAGLSPTSPAAVLKGEAGAPRPAAADVGDTPPGTPLPRERLSLEAIIGTRWLNWVGVVTFLLGIAFFLKYAYDRDWIGPSGRTVIAYLAAAAALWIGARGRRRGYLLAADGVTALGFGVLYAATYFGTVRYELVWMPRAMGFVLMILITAAGIRTALRHRSQIIAVMALLGGYLTPVLLSTGKDEGETLVFYLTLLGAGAAGCVIRERWRFVEFLAIAATHVLFLAWFGSHYTPARMALALAGTAVFFSLFTALAVLPAWTGKERGRLEDALALALNAFLAFPLLYFTIEKDHRVALMALTLAGGAVFAIIRLRLSLREEGQSPLSLAALCLAMAFLTIAFPLKLGLWGLPIAWAAEGTALLYLGFLLPNVWMLSGAAAVHFLAGVYLLTHLPLHRAPFIPVLNGAFLSWAFVIAALFFSSALARRDGPELREPWRRRAAVFGVVTYTGAGVALLLLGLREVQESYGLLLNLKAYHATPWHWLLFAAFPFLFALRARCTLADIDSRLTHAAFIVAAAAFVWGLGAYRPAGHLAIINSWFLAGLLLAGSFALGAAIGRRLAWPELPYYHGASLAALFLLLSVECFQSFLRWQALGRSAKHWAFASLSVLWAAYAAALLAAGLRRNQRALRLAAFGLFGLTVVKVLLIDTAELEAVYRILGCLTLGALLVTGSFAYTRFLRGGAAPPQQG